MRPFPLTLSLHDDKPGAPLEASELPENKSLSSQTASRRTLSCSGAGDEAGPTHSDWAWTGAARTVSHRPQRMLRSPPDSLGEGIQPGMSSSLQQQVGMSNLNVLRPSEGTKMGLFLPELAVKLEGHHFLDGGGISGSSAPRGSQQPRGKKGKCYRCQAVQRRDKLSF